jgi:1,2-phenylacetyl-CoA epoxidase PaaB subunit
VTDPVASVYLVFARLRQLDPLAQVGSVRASNLDLACSYARTTYDEDKWIEMVVVPRSAVTWVTTEETA